jgi:hypothetical protein
VNGAHRRGVSRGSATLRSAPGGEAVARRTRIPQKGGRGGSHLTQSFAQWDKDCTMPLHPKACAFRAARGRRDPQVQASLEPARRQIGQKVQQCPVLGTASEKMTDRVEVASATVLHFSATTGHLCSAD